MMSLQCLVTFLETLTTSQSCPLLKSQDIRQALQLVDLPLQIMAPLFIYSIMFPFPLQRTNS